MTLNDFKRRIGRYFALLRKLGKLRQFDWRETWLSATEMYRNESSFRQLLWFTTIFEEIFENG